MSPVLVRFALLTAIGIQCAATVPAQASGGSEARPAVVPMAIDAGLEWLRRQQAVDGSWRDAGGYGSYPAAMTGLAGMAFLAAGSTPTRGQYWREVRAAADFLIRIADPSTGLISLPALESRPMYGHGFAMMFLASVHGMEEDVHQQERLAGVLRRGIALTVAAQSTAGGWTYLPQHNDDEGSVTVTQLQALRACRMAGLTVDKTCIDRAVAYLRRCQNADGGIRYALWSGPESRPAITAAGIAALYSTGIYDDQPFVERAFRYCEREIPGQLADTDHGYYTHLYWSQALWQRGGAAWRSYHERLTPVLLRLQQRDGAWSADGVGAVYGTAVALQILQLPTTQVPIHQR